MPTLSPHAGRRRIPRGIRRLLGPLSLLGAWQAATSTGLLDRQTLAPPAVVARTAWRLVASGDLQGHLLVSLHRVVSGLAIGVTVGVVLALVAGLARLGEDVVDSTMQMLRTVPVLALVPLMILWFGIGETPKIVLIAIGTAFPVYLNTFAAIRAVDGGLVEAAGTLGLRRLGVIRHVILPGALPGFLIGLRYSLGMDDLDSVAIHCLVRDDLFEVRTEWVVAQHTDLKRSISVKKCVCRPFHKFGEVEQKGSLDLILSCGLRLGYSNQNLQRNADNKYFPL